MDEREVIDRYDLVEVIQVPEHYEGMIDIGDMGVVVEKYDDENFEVECVEPGGSYKWLEPLHLRYIRLRSKDPYGPWIEQSLTDKPLMQESIPLGAAIGTISGAVIGSGLGAITGSLNGILVGMLIGLVLGALTGVLTAALTVKIAGRRGGIAVGYFTGMIFGGVFGMLIGALIPVSLRMHAHTEGLPVLDAFMTGSFETAIFISFPLSVVATIVGVWISGKNQIPRDLKERYRQ